MSDPIGIVRSKTIAAARCLLEAQPLGFTFEHVRKQLELPSGEGREVRRVRRQIDRLCEERILNNVDRGIFIAGEYSLSVAEQDLATEVAKAFRDAGGILSMEELLARLPHHMAGRQSVLSYLVDCPEYRSTIPITGRLRDWMLKPELRHRIPLAGKHQLLEIQLMKMSEGPLPVGWGLEALRAQRLRIGQALEDAREFRGLSVAQLLTRPPLRQALAERLARVAEGVDGGEGDQAVAALLHRHGGDADAALAAFWDDLERAERMDCFQRVLDVACWDAIGAALGFDPAALSRGALVRRTT